MSKAETERDKEQSTWRGCDLELGVLALDQLTNTLGHRPDPVLPGAGPPPQVGLTAEFSRVVLWSSLRDCTHRVGPTSGHSGDLV